MIAQIIELDGKQYVMLPRKEYDELKTLAKSAVLPELPEPDEKGNYPAGEYLRVSIARDIIRDRAELGLTQKALAQRAGIRFETLCRIETGKHTPSVPTIEKIDRAIAKVRQEQNAKGSHRKSVNGRRG